MNSEKKRGYIILAVINAVFLCAFTVLTAVLCGITNRLSSQSAALRWNADSGGSYAQVSVFYPEKLGLNLDSVYTMRVDIEKKLTENSITAENSSARIWYDGYSALTTLSVTSSREEYTIVIDADVIATGGDYFKMHPLELLSGYYYSDDDLMQDRVLLDENLAWQLFGSSNVEGMTVLINEKRFYVAGVIKPDSDSASSYTYGTKPHMYISYSGLLSVSEDDYDTPITCYEAVLPNPVTGLAESIIEETSVGDDSERTIIENSERFSLKNLFAIAFDGGKRAVVDTELAYPFWENAARITEENAAVVLVWAAAMLIVPILTVMYFAFLLIHRRKTIAHKAAEKVKNSASKIIKRGRYK